MPLLTLLLLLLVVQKGLLVLLCNGRQQVGLIKPRPYLDVPDCLPLWWVHFRLMQAPCTPQ